MSADGSAMGDRFHALHEAAADAFARPPFAHAIGIHEMRDSLPPGRGRHHFFPKTSFKAELSSMAPATLSELKPAGCLAATAQHCYPKGTPEPGL
jgi:hypothetical protein